MTQRVMTPGAISTTGVTMGTTATAAGQQPWYARPLRWMQLSTRANEVESFDVAWCVVGRLLDPLPR